MTKLLRLLRNSALIAAGTLWLSSRLAALEPTEWKNRQSVNMPHAGVVKLTLPPATLDACRAGLADLRLVDPAGHEVAYLIDQAAPSIPPTSRVPRAFRTTLNDTTTEVVVETGTNDPIVGIRVTSPAASFLKPVRVESSPDGDLWTVVRAGAPLFRQAGAEQLQIDFEPRRAAYLRLVVDDARTPPVPITGATVLLEPVTQPAPTTVLAGTALTHRDEFAGETVLTLDLGARNVPIASVHLGATDPLFTRKVRLTVRELHDETAAESTLGSGTIYRLEAEGLLPTSELDVPARVTSPSRELLIHIANGDSPPLAIDNVTVRQRPIWLVFNAATPGTYTLLTGNPDVPSARYDLAGFAATLHATTPSAIEIGPLQANDGYRRRDTLADTPLLGGPIDVADWRFRKPVQLAAPGVQQLELDPEVLAHASGNLADLRLARDGAQVPYLLERPALSRALLLTVTPIHDPQRPTFSRWELVLPETGLPVERLTITSPSPLFQRHLRVSEHIKDASGTAYDWSLGEADWSQSPGNTHPLVLALNARPKTGVLLVETDNGDNPPLALGKVEAIYPVARLLFKADPAPLTLYYGNSNVGSPRYDIALVAAQLLAADKHVATLGPEESATGSGGWAERMLGTAHAGALFWGVLALVVVLLLVVVAKLLPKPPAQS